MAGGEDHGGHPYGGSTHRGDGPPPSHRARADVSTNWALPLFEYVLTLRCYFPGIAPSSGHRSLPVKWFRVSLLDAEVALAMVVELREQPILRER
jgi:hypothetical protein